MAMRRANLHLAGCRLEDQTRFCRALLEDVTNKRPDFVGLETSLSNQVLRHLKKCATKKDECTSTALHAALGGVWHEVRGHKAFTVGETSVRCQAEPEDPSHILFRCPHWHKERREVELPADDDTILPCVKLHGILYQQPECLLSSRMNLFWCTRQELSRCGLVVQEDTVLTPTTEDVG
eukprot:2026227-Amphidinium_carterae.3